ncbi:hypothetical protein ACHAPJ_007428 [Fusarium lateritium]
MASDEPIRQVTTAKDCAVLFGDHGPVVACGDRLGLSMKLKARLVSSIATGIGISIDIPIGEQQSANENSGFGVRFGIEPSQNDAMKRLDTHRLEVKFPRNFRYDIRDASEWLYEQFPNPKRTKDGLCYVRVQLGHSKVTINGFGIPFANVEDLEVEDWVKDNAPVAGPHTLLDILKQTTFYLVVPTTMDLTIKLLDIERLPSPFSYPYGDDQSWELTRFKSLLQANKGLLFEPIYQHQSDVSHMTAVNQSVVQDVMWIHEVGEQIAKIRIRAYFFQITPNDGSTAENLYALIPFPAQLRQRHFGAWRRLINQKSFNMFLYHSPQTEGPAGSWACKVVPHPKRLGRFDNHCANDLDLVLRVHTPLDDEAVPWDDDMDIKTFADRGSADAQPSNPVACGLPVEDGKLRDDLTMEESRLLQQVKDRMDLHRAVMRGAGLFDWMTKTDDANAWRQLPTVSFLDIGNQAYANAIVNEALPQDRARFRRYLRNRPLGISIITGVSAILRTNGQPLTSNDRALALARLPQVLQQLSRCKRNSARFFVLPRPMFPSTILPNILMTGLELSQGD